MHLHIQPGKIRDKEHRVEFNFSVFPGNTEVQIYDSMGDLLIEFQYYEAEHYYHFLCGPMHIRLLT